MIQKIEDQMVEIEDDTNDDISLHCHLLLEHNQFSTASNTMCLTQGVSHYQHYQYQGPNNKE